MKYLEVKSNNISFTDTNHNVKNRRYQLVGGYCAAVIGLYCFGPWLLNMDGVAKQLIRVEDFVSNAVVLRLASPSTAKNRKFDIDCDINCYYETTIVFNHFVNSTVK